jgi:hypothetical protein
MNQNMVKRTGFKAISEFLYQKRPQILTGIACAGVVSTTILGIRATFRSKKELEEYVSNFKKESRKNKIKIAKEVCKIYASTIVSGTLSITCMVASQKINTARAAALASLYSISKEALDTYKANVIETIGTVNEKKITDKIIQKKLDDNPPREKDNLILVDNESTVLCYDSQTGRYFYSDYETLRGVINTLDHRLMTDMFISLNEFYQELDNKDLDQIPLGNELGWYVDQGLLNVEIDTMIASNNKPCIVLTFNNLQHKTNYV